MGKGDKKSKKGKIKKGTFGNSRLKKKIKEMMKRREAASKKDPNEKAKPKAKVKRAPKKKAVKAKPKAE